MTIVQDDAAGSETRTAAAAAMEFLQAALAAGPVPAAELTRMACERGLTAKAVRRARESLAVQVQRHGFGPGGLWAWALPQQRIDAQPQRYEIIQASNEACYACGEHGEIFLLRYSDLSVAMHQGCAEAWFGWLDAMASEPRERIVGRMKQRMKGQAGHAKV